VLCEKPAGIKSIELKKSWELAKRKKLIYMVGYNHRYHPAYMMAKQAFDKGEIGDLMFIRARYGFGGRPGYEKEWRFNKNIAGGGELIDQGMHMIDMARWFMGEIKDVRGITENMYWGGEVEDNAFILLRGRRKQVASIHVSWTNWEWIHSFEIFGKSGYLWIDGLDTRYRGPERLTIGKFNPQLPKFPEEKIVRFEDERKEDSFARELAAFANAVRGKKVEIPSGKDGYEALKIVETVYKQNL
jgi:predicted dehydrogenase